mmetsp:Transcript_26788/g.56565  ORF Transcript_26788/g.56565 Transcript_26788/m.56565 type:complete len:806 (-) Transcript_26788:177-2594(-)
MKIDLAILLPICLCGQPVAAALDGSRSRHLSSDDFTRGAAIVPYTLPWWHPEIQSVAVNRIAGPSDHPLLDDDPAFQRFIRANTGESHRFFDGRRGYIQRPFGLPGGHPNCDDYFIYEEFPETDLPSVYFDHPDIHEAYLNGEQLPDGHPSVSVLLQKVLPKGHPDVDDLFWAHEELPEWHPDLNLVVQDNPIEPIYLFSGHPDVDDDLGEPIGDHPTIHHLFEAHLPESHPDIDDLMREGFKLPSWHPKISSIVRVRSSSASPGALLCFGVAALFVVFVVSRIITKSKNSKQTREVVLSKGGDEDTSSGSDDLSESKDGGFEIVMHRNNHGSNFNPNEERVLVYKEKKSNWKKVFGKRVAKTSISTGEVLMCLLYVLINVSALLVSPTYDLGIGFGSLSAGNTVFTFMTAARNSFFTWFLGIAFDHIILYHRFIGRLTVALALIHSCFYIDDVINKTTDLITVTGLVSLGCGFVIVLSSVNYLRRKFFNMFFWIHCGSFLGFVAGLFFHAPGARPFVVAAIACYTFDKGLQMLRKMPKRNALFEKVDERTVHVQFEKGHLSSLLAKHEVGQYVFVNFPSLSLKEWHPFSVASGPSDPHIDIYIRALGDHTKKIVKHAEKYRAENKEVKIRVDGPYGKLPFNYCRYGSILFVGGGIGITPIIGILKDIFANSENDSKKKTPNLCIKKVSVVWVMPRAAESSLFLDLLNSFHLKSLEDPLMPELNLSIYVTRDDVNGMSIGEMITYSKPQFNVVLDGLVEKKPESMRSMLVYACGPGGMAKQLWDASMKKKSKKLRVDFYHEKFEF